MQLLTKLFPKFFLNKNLSNYVYIVTEVFWRYESVFVMELIQEHKSKIDEIMSEITCQKDFTCYKSGFENLSKIKDVQAEGFLECLEADSQDCQFSLFFGEEPSCLCPLRIYIANKLRR